jgi:hypothetical protein
MFSIKLGIVLTMYACFFFNAKKLLRNGVEAGVLYYGSFGTIVTNTNGMTLMIVVKLSATNLMCLCPSQES